MKAESKLWPGYLRRNAAAKHLNVSIRTLGELQRRRCIPFFRVTKRCILFKISDLDCALERYRVEAFGADYMDSMPSNTSKVAPRIARLAVAS